MRTWLIIALLTAVALGGCAGEDPQDVDDAGPSDDGDADGDGGNGTSGGGSGSGGESTGNGTGNGTNEAPVVTFTADVLNGTAPLLVNFTIDARDDSDGLAWSLLVSDNETSSGTEFPAVVNMTFDQAGTYLVTATVTDGAATVNETITIVVEPAPLAPETWHAFRHSCGDGQTYSLDLTVTETGLNSCGGPAPEGAKTTYPGVGTSRGFAAGEPVAGQVRAAIWGVGPEMSATVVLRADGAEVGSWTTDTAAATGHPLGDVPTGRDDIRLAFSGTLAAEVPADAVLDLAVTIEGSAVIFSTTGGDDSTFITLGS